MKDTVLIKKIVSCMLIVVSLVGCMANAKSINSPTASSADTNPTETTSPSSPISNRTPTEASPTSIGKLLTPLPTATIPAEARLKFQCLQVAPALLADLPSSGIVVMDNLTVTPAGRYQGGSALLNMATGEMIQSEAWGSIISPDKKLMAYTRPTFDEQGRVIKDELVIATADGQPQKVVRIDKIVAAAYGPTQQPIPLETGMVGMPGWFDNQRLAITLALNHEQGRALEPATLLVLNPFTGGQQMINADYPKYMTTGWTHIPGWDGWDGVVYDPTLTYAIYPRFIGDDQQMYTYGLWDRTKHQLVASLENIYTAYTSYASAAVINDQFPMPRWSEDGSKFVFRGRVQISEKPNILELYQVSRDGQVEQLTHLTSIANVQYSNLSWSPDGRYIAMFLNTWAKFEKQARVAVLDTKTLNVTNYCVQVTYSGDGYGGGQPPAPIWSPDGKQFLVVDWYEKDHRRVILIDIGRGLAAQIAQDVTPMGWMMSTK